MTDSNEEKTDEIYQNEWRRVCLCRCTVITTIIYTLVLLRRSDQLAEILIKRY